MLPMLRLKSIGMTLTFIRPCLLRMCNSSLTRLIASMISLNYIIELDVFELYDRKILAIISLRF